MENRNTVIRDIAIVDLTGASADKLAQIHSISGAALLLLSDLVARVVIMPVILPIGALTAFLGGPLFLYLLFKGRRQT